MIHSLFTMNGFKFLSHQGYSVVKSSITEHDLKSIKDDLTVKPFVPKDFEVIAGGSKPFKLYQEGPTKIYVPKFYGLKKFGDPDIDKCTEGKCIDVSFTGALRSDQADPVKAFLDATKTNHHTGGILNLTCASGKCLGKDTPILMHDNTVKKVQDIKEHDVLMGDDAGPRRVLSTCRGKSVMYTIHQSNGMTYRVNDVHILTLWDIEKYEIVDIEVSKVYCNYSKYLGIRIIDGFMSFGSITVVKEEVEDDYYGFMIDGNHRFLLSDGTVTHNTVMAIHLICVLRQKTLVIVHKDFLLQQWKERIEQFAPTARVGLIKAKTIDTVDKDIVLASLQSLCMKDYPSELFDEFGFVVVDEVHHTSAEVFSRALRKVAFKYTLGLSATINRKDGLSKVFKWYLGDVLYSNVTTKKKHTDDVDILCSYFYTPDPSYSREEYMMRDKLNISKMINNICEYPPRLVYIADVIQDILRKEPERRMIVLSDRKQHLVNLGLLLEKMSYKCGHYFGGMKQEELKKSESAQIILGTFCMVSEGFDCKQLDTLVLASPKSDVVQSVGRILREEAQKRRHVPLVVDIIDEFSIFQRQSIKRIKYYKQQKYNMIGEKNEISNSKLVKLDGPCFQPLE